MQFGKLVHKILGGKGIASAEEVGQDIFHCKVPGSLIFTSDDRTVSRSRTTFSIQGRLIGRINFVGPTHHKII
jgi:hypothetical protein